MLYRCARLTLKYVHRRAPPERRPRGFDRASVAVFMCSIRRDRSRSCGTVIRSLGYDNRRASATHATRHPKTEEVIHCLAELVTAGSPEIAERLITARPPEACQFR